MSMVTQTTEKIIFDLKVYTKLFLSPQQKPIQDIFKDPLTNKNIFPKHDISCIDLKEAMAEKMRAALTRIIPAIRDFYDIRYAQHQRFDF
jgi:Nucleotidyl transferase AbiEii toxin, Type IV TA system